MVVVDVIQPTLHIAYDRLHAANLELHIPRANTCRRRHIPYGTPHAAYHIVVAVVAEVLH